MMPQSYLTHVCFTIPLSVFLANLVVIQNWDYFTSCIYTTQEYARDYSDFCWNLRGKDFTYKAIHSYFKGMARDQEEILKGRRDIRAFSENIPRLSGLKTIKLSFAGVKEDRLLWFSRRLFADNGETYSVHIEAVLNGMIAAKHNGLMLESVEVEGMNSHPTIDRGDLAEILQQGLAHVKKFKVVDSPGMLSLMSTISLPWLERFEVVDCWLVGSKLIRFLEAQDGIIEHVEFQKISLSYGKIGQTARCSYCVKKFWEMVSETGNTGKIEKLVIVRIA